MASNQVKQQAEQVLGQAQQQVKPRLDSQKDRAAEQVSTMAQALRQTGEQLRGQNQEMIGQYVEQGAQQLERVSGYLHQHDVDQLADEVKHFARRQPALFLAATFGAGFLAARFLKSSSQAGQMMGQHVMQQSLEVNVPVRIAYNQWTQFETFPRFMEGIEEVRQLDDRRLHWRAQIAGKTEEWDAIITEQEPDQRIAWRSTTGPHNAGVVTFQLLGPSTTRVTLRMEYTPQGPAEMIGSTLGLVERRVAGDLQRFKAFIESRGTATGAWRGEIENETVVRQQPAG